MGYKLRHSTVNMDIYLLDEQTFDLELSTGLFIKHYEDVSSNVKICGEGIHNLSLWNSNISCIKL